MNDAPLVTTETLNVGDVVQISVHLQDRSDRSKWFWWKRFACVTRVRNRRSFDALTLKMRPDMDTDLRTVDLAQDGDRPQVVTRLDESRWPQGVVAMRMKLLARGMIKLGKD